MLLTLRLYGMEIIKASGERENFDESKLRDSLRRAGTPDQLIDKVTARIRISIRDGMTTNQIYQKAFSLLKKFEREIASRYSLRRALLSFGPSGFPFEKFLAELMRSQGFQVMNDQVVSGKCIEHEVDVVAYSKDQLIMIEAKFHNSPGVKTDAKVALYIKSRKDDLSGVTFNYGTSRNLDDLWLVTNTKFSSSAIKYAKCSGLTLIGWNYPSKGNLQDMVEESGLHPITCLTSLSKSDKDLLLGNGNVLCRDVAGKPELLSSLGFSAEVATRTAAEATALCRV